MVFFPDRCGKAGVCAVQTPGSVPQHGERHAAGGRGPEQTQPFPHCQLPHPVSLHHQGVQPRVCGRPCDLHPGAPGRKLPPGTSPDRAISRGCCSAKMAPQPFGMKGESRDFDQWLRGENQWGRIENIHIVPEFRQRYLNASHRWKLAASLALLSIWDEMSLDSLPTDMKYTDVGVLMHILAPVHLCFIVSALSSVLCRRNITTIPTAPSGITRSTA